MHVITSTSDEVHISSVYHHVGRPGGYIYDVTRFAQKQLSRSRYAEEYLGRPPSRASWAGLGAHAGKHADRRLRFVPRQTSSITRDCGRNPFFGYISSRYNRTGRPQPTLAGLGGYVDSQTGSFARAQTGENESRGDRTRSRAPLPN